MDNELIQVALGQKPADIVIKNGKLVNVITHEVYETEIAIANGKIASTGPVPAGAIGPDTQVIDAKGMYLAPGFMDAHIHIESSMLSYTEFAKMVVKHGTTAVASEMSYAADGSLQKMALFSIGLVLFLFIMMINVFLNLVLKREKE